jgi:hypothetical protein
VRARVDILEKEDFDAILGERGFRGHPAACTAAARQRLALTLELRLTAQKEADS